jgi:aminomethyltransferase
MIEQPKRTPLYEVLKAKGGKFVDFAGFEMPIQFEGIKREHQAVREAAGLFDVSHMGEIWLEGSGALAYGDYLVTNDIFAIEDGQIAYSPMCLESGGIVDDLLVYRVASDKILLVVNAANHDKDLEHIKKHRPDNVEIVDRSFETGQLALQGPKAEEILSKIADASLVHLKGFRFSMGAIADVPCLVSRTGYTGEDGFEIYCPGDKLIQVFDAIAKAGERSGLKQIGLGARDTLRLEAKLCLYGNDIYETTSPLEAGLGWTVKLESRDFLGRDAIVAQKAAGLTRKLVGFEMVDRGIARHGYPVVEEGGDADGPSIAVICSGSPSPTLGKSIGLVYLPRRLAKKGTVFGVVIRGAVKRAKVVKTPFYVRSTK